MFPVFENLRAFFNSRPPLVVFMICLGSFAIALITFAYIVKTKDIPDSDVTEDWNTFLEKFSKIDLCFSQNASENVFNSTRSKLSTGDLSPLEIYQIVHEKFKQIDLYQSIQLHKIVTREVESSAKPEGLSQKITPVTDKGDSSSITAKPTPTSEYSGLRLRNVSFVLHVEVVLSAAKTPHVSWTGTQFVTVIQGDKLNLNRHLTDAEMVATFTFPNNVTSDTCQTWDKGVCRKHLILACVQLQGPAAMFPNTPMPEVSEVCQTPHYSGEEMPGLRFMVPTLPNSHSQADMTCQQGSYMSTYFSFDESLTVLLSLHNRSVINLRLMRTSYFLFVMVVTFLCYAMIKGRKSKNKNSHIPYVEKIPA